jgi:lipopolysaccharide biosynthesis glycosyltransferase
MQIFTSISLNYLPKARILASAVKRFHPDWTFHLLVSDRITNGNKPTEEINFAQEPFDRIVWVDSLDIDDIYSWIFKHSIVELCTAVKGPFLQQLIREGAEKIIYLDPDTVVFNPIDPLIDLLDDNAILLTPHLLDYPDNPQSILDNEIMSVMRHGVFNLGFFAINPNKPDGARFAEWWGNRLLNYCYADYDHGLFTDQKWCDLVPSYFKDYYVIRDPGYNVASWNIDKRLVSISENGQIQIDGRYPLRFYHFTGYDSGAGNTMTQRYSNGNLIINDIWSWYHYELQNKGQNIFVNKKNYYNYYDNGIEITKDARQVYRQRKDLQEAFPDPYKTKGDTGKYRGGFYSWYTHNK